jgi:hypothetical protein
VAVATKGAASHARSVIVHLHAVDLVSVLVALVAIAQVSVNAQVADSLIAAHHVAVHLVIVPIAHHVTIALPIVRPDKTHVTTHVALNNSRRVILNHVLLNSALGAVILVRRVVIFQLRAKILAHHAHLMRAHVQR